MWTLCLAALTQCVFKAHPGCSIYENFVPFHGWIIFQGMSVECPWFPFLSSVLSLLPWSSVTRRSCCRYVFRLVLCTQRKGSPWREVIETPTLAPPTLWTSWGRARMPRSFCSSTRGVLGAEWNCVVSEACGADVLSLGVIAAENGVLTPHSEANTK